MAQSAQPPIRINPKRLGSDESMIANWHDAMQGLETAKSFCANFHTDNENRIRKTADELGLSQKEYTDQLLNHYEQIPDVAHLRETLDLAIDILSKITYRKKDG
jgi:asparagine synthetase B (glutamine-hydrolysing)